jgi:hypothetical protein
MTQQQQWRADLLQACHAIFTEPYAIDRATQAINDKAREENRNLRLSIMEIGFNPDLAIIRERSSQF